MPHQKCRKRHCRKASKSRYDDSSQIAMHYKRLYEKQVWYSNLCNHISLWSFIFGLVILPVVAIIRQEMLMVFYASPAFCFLIPIVLSIIHYKLKQHAMHNLAKYCFQLYPDDENACLEEIELLLWRNKLAEPHVLAITALSLYRQ